MNTLARRAFQTILAAGVAGAALAQSVAAAPAATPAATRGACFYAKNANNFVAADDRTVNVRVGVRQVYQLELFAPCTGIAWSRSIALVSRPGSFVCTGSANAVDLYIHGATGRRRCPVTSIRKLTEAEIAALPKKQRP